MKLKIVLTPFRFVMVTASNKWNQMATITPYTIRRNEAKWLDRWRYGEING